LTHLGGCFSKQPSKLVGSIPPLSDKRIIVHINGHGKGHSASPKT
jgi:hypothetical protein